MTVIKKWLKNLGLVFALPLLLVLALGLWVGFKFVTHGQTDDAEHLAAKAEYLNAIAASQPHANAATSASRPNIIFILYDDLGYGDLGFTGSRAVKTPAIDRLAEGGVVLSNFYSPSPICSPSRAGFMTGRHAPRAGLPNVVFPTGSNKAVLNILAGENVRLPAEEITIADLLKAAGYRTGMIGKWHMGDREPSIPNSFGFDHYYGALYSNDMEPFALYRDTEVVIQAPVDQTTLDRLYTDEAVSFINQERQQNEPFFLYFSHNFPHIPLFVAPELAGQSQAGTYGDVVEALDAGVGQIVEALSAQGVLDNTIIILSSDNGPWYEGSAGHSRGRKGQTWDGGMHVPFLIHWPSGLDGGREIEGMSSGLDLLPTMADWLDLPLPSDRLIDGRSIRTMLENDTETPHDYLYYFANEKLMAIRDQRYKYLAPRTQHYSPNDSAIALGVGQGAWLIDMSLDPNEAYDISMLEPERKQAMEQSLEKKRKEMKENLRGWVK